MKKFKIACWWTFIYRIIVLACIMLIIAGSIGLNGLRYGGTSVLIDRSSDYKLYQVEVDSRHALYVSPKSQDISLVIFKKKSLF